MKEKFIESPLLGKSRVLLTAEIIELRRMVKESPVACFQELNKMFNNNGMALSIERLS